MSINPPATSFLDIAGLALEYCALQDVVLCAMHKSYPKIAFDRDPHRWPQRGIIEAAGDSWRFVRHGLGYRFTRVHNSWVLEAHEFVQDPPFPFDSYRLQEYALSKKIQTVIAGGQAIRCEDISALQAALEMLRIQGLIELEPRSDPEQKIKVYRIANTNSQK